MAMITIYYTRKHIPNNPIYPNNRIGQGFERELTGWLWNVINSILKVNISVNQVIHMIILIDVLLQIIE